jgi:phosphomannomutase
MALIESISGIRGTIGGRIGNMLSPIHIVKYTSAFVSLLRTNRTERLRLVVGRDARMSGGIINALVCSTLQSMGVDVLDVGLSTTPTVEMAVLYLQADGGIIITASHNPKNWNALKLLNSNGEFISANDGHKLLEIIREEHFEYAEVDELGSYTLLEDAIEKHITAILALNLVKKEAIEKADFSVVIDAINSTGAIAIPLLLKTLGIKKIHLLNGEVNGHFAHNPEPLPEHLTQISKLMKSGHYDLGIVVDPDVDRLALVMPDGEMFGEEYTLVAIADYVLQHQKGATCSNLSSSRALDDLSSKYGVSCHKSPVGEVNVIQKMKETNAVIGGEGNGGIIYPPLHYGRDALVGIALLLSYMATSHTSIQNLKASYPSYFISKNKIELKPGMNVQSILKHIAEKYSYLKINTIDGLKMDASNYWIHLRSSNTEPIIRIYVEASTQAEADQIAEEIKMVMKN